MKLAAKALYNSLRMSACQDPTILVKPWQVEDYRKCSLEELFRRLEMYEILFDRHDFAAYADDYDSPEEFFEDLVAEEPYAAEETDQIYLLIFELWRRLIPERQSISLVCDELDSQIFSFDNGELERRQLLDDAISNFYQTLQKGLETGLKSEELFSVVCEHCANDIPSFLYDYISELLDQHENSYASELIQQFYSFMPEKCWFDFLLARLTAAHSIRQANLRMRQIFHENLSNPNSELNFEILSILSQSVDNEFFREVTLQTLSLIDSHEDLIELFSLIREFFDANGSKEKKQQIEVLMSQQGQITFDEAVAKLKEIF